MKPVKFAPPLLALIIAATGQGQKPEPAKASAGSVTWKFDNLKEVGGNEASVIGTPQVIKVGEGNAVLFDGIDEGLLVNINPVSGAQAFTVEAVFRPDAGGNAEQRWFHIQEETGDNRVLLETRLAGDQWFLDSFIKSGANSHALFAEKFKHRVGEWYHVALVYDGATMRHYVNGQEELSAPLAIKPLVGGRTSIGVRMNRVFWFKGAVSKARFTSAALSAKEFMTKN